MSLYALRKKYGKKYEEAPDVNTTNIYRNIVIDITEQINEIEFRVSQLEKEQTKEKRYFCIYCKREMEIGGIDSLGIKYGCYNPECPAVVEKNYYHFSLPHNRNDLILETLRGVLGK